MNGDNKSLLYSTLRTFLLTLSVCFAIFVGVAGFIIVIALMETVEKEPKLSTSAKVLPDAEGHLDVLSTADPIILRIDINGIIGVDGLTHQKIYTQLVESRYGKLKEDRVKGIFLYINSPGGTYIDADAIYRDLKEYKQRYQVPILAYVDGLCASGGLYVAMAADKIYASDASVIGSVGTILSTFFNYHKLMEKIGVDSLTITAGKNKDELNPFRPWKENEDSSLRQLTDYFYESFVNIVTTNRPQINRDKLIHDYGANIFQAVEAKSIGFIDQAGFTLTSALKTLVKDVGLEEKKYQVVRLEEKTWLSSLVKAESPIFTGKIKHQFVIAPELNPELSNQMLLLYRPKFKRDF